MDKKGAEWSRQDTEKPREEGNIGLVEKVMATYTELSAKYSPDLQISHAFANYIKAMPFDFLFDEMRSEKGEAKIREAEATKQRKNLGPKRKEGRFTRMEVEAEKAILRKMKMLLHDLESMENDSSGEVETIMNGLTVGTLLSSLMGDFLFLTKLHSEIIYSESDFLEGQDQREKVIAETYSAFYDDPIIKIAVANGLLRPREEKKGTFWVVGGTLRETMERWVALLMNSPNPNLQKTETFHTTKLAKILYSKKSLKPYTERAITLATDGLYPKRTARKG